MYIKKIRECGQTSLLSSVHQVSFDIQVEELEKCASGQAFELLSDLNQKNSSYNSTFPLQRRRIFPWRKFWRN